MVAHGLGLIGIRERASQVGGTLRVESAPGKGTRVTVELPAQVQTDERGILEDSSLALRPAIHEVLGG